MPPIERVVTFGPRERGVGILSSPAQPTDVGLLILNAGLLHRVGHCRLGVRLGRAAAQAGFPALRFDFPGIGDSEGRSDGRVDIRASAEDLATVSRKLQDMTGVTRVVAYGLCRGADVALTAVPDMPDLSAISMVDPWCFPTPTFWLARYGPSLASPDVWLRAPSTLKKLLSRSVGASPDAEPVREMMDKPAVARLLTTAVSRGCILNAFFTGGYRDAYSYEGQFREAFSDVAFGDCLRERYVPEADHLVTQPAHQQTLLTDTIGLLRDVAGRTRPA